MRSHRPLVAERQFFHGGGDFTHHLFIERGFRFVNAGRIDKNDCPSGRVTMP